MALAFERCRRKTRLGLKGPRAAEWLVAQGIVAPGQANSWSLSEEDTGGDGLFVARLGQSEFFLEQHAGSAALSRLSLSLKGSPSGVYPALREDWAFELGGERVHEVLAQVCSVNFAGLQLVSHPVIMTLMIGVSVLVLPQGAGERQYRIWCDPTFGQYFADSLGEVVNDCGGRYRGASE
jgi:sarcosine oxidase subunit gamma